MMISSVAIVGDIHGDAIALRKCLQWLVGSWSGHVVFVGDYINGGSDSKSTLDQLVAFKKQVGSKLTFLLGNHDLALLRFLEGSDLVSFLKHGGLQTIKDYVGPSAEGSPIDEFRNFFPADHLAFLQSLDTYFETESILVTHAGLNPEKPESRAIEDVVLRNNSDIFSNGFYLHNKVIVCGHYVQRYGRLFMSNNLICIDSGCGSVDKAPLTLLTLPDREIITFGA